MLFNLKNKFLLIIFAGVIALLIIVSFLSAKPANKTQTISPNTSPSVITPSPTTLTTTTPQPSQSSSDIQKQQQADINFGNDIKKIQQSYPWFNNLPIMNANYFVYFDPLKKQLVADIYSKSKNLSAQQVEDIKTSITSQLSQLGIPLAQYPITWIVGQH